MKLDRRPSDATKEAMNTPTTWICDKCGEKIESADDGWLQWLRIKDEEKDRYGSDGLQLVHDFASSRRANRPSCLYEGRQVLRTRNATTADLHLKEIAGPDAHMLLLSFISEGDFEDSSQVLEMIKRLFVPGYEEVRHHYDRALAEGVVQQRGPHGFPDQRQIKQILEWVKERD